MEKFGKILLLILNIFINVFLAVFVFLLLIWMIFEITPNDFLQKTITWTDALIGREPQERTQQLSQKYQQRARRNLYVQEPNKKDKSENGRITQPYKYE